MKCLKMAGLAVIAAAALTTFLGVGTASATVLCKTPTDPCPEGWRIPAGTEITASLEVGASTSETDASGNVRRTCTQSVFEGDQENEGGATETVTIDITEISRSSCVTEIPPGRWQTGLEIHQIPGTNNGTLTAAGEDVTLAFFGSSCTYRAAHVGTLTGGQTPTMKLEVTLKKTGGSGFLCPSAVGWDAAYSITGPTPLFVTEG
ncbi:MAG TPA: hypothetical protein VN733_02040 [Solirubrobacterales bacterium]|nr:hypothetical protein [Solirubrobacterales bacterium]